MPSLFSSLGRIEALERTVSGLPKATALLREHVAEAAAQIQATSAAVQAIGEQVGLFADQVAGQEPQIHSADESDVDLRVRLDAAWRSMAETFSAISERLTQLEASIERHDSMLRDSNISLVRVDRQLQAQGKEGKTLAEAVMHRIALLSKQSDAA